MDLGLTGKVALVTGSSRGIGRGIALTLAQEGCDVMLTGRDEAALRGVVESIEKLGRKAQFETVDLRKEEAPATLVAAVQRAFGRLDILVNNAGTTQVISHADLEAASPDVWRRIFDVNVIGTWQVTVAAVPHLRASGRGQVVNVSSLAGERPTGSSIPYACSKAAVSHMTRLLANTLGPDVRVNAVAPGLVDTPWTEDWDTVRAFVGAQAPLQRSGQPEDVAEVIHGLVRSRYVTGEVVLIDGGLALR
jgi:ketoreductase RED2